MAALNGRDFTLTEHGDPERILGSAVTESLFKVLGIAPIVGRPLTGEDETPGAPPVALLAKSFWYVRLAEIRRLLVVRSR